MGLLLLQNSMLKLKATGRKNFMAQASQLERYVILSTLPLYFPMFFGLNFPEYAIIYPYLHNHVNYLPIHSILQQPFGYTTDL